MSIESEKIIIDQKMSELKAFHHTKRMLKELHRDIIKMERKVDYFKSAGLFASIPTATKAACIRLYQLSLGLKTDFEADADFDELFNQE